MSHSSGKPRDSNGSTNLWKRLLVLAVVLVAVVAGYVQFGDWLTLESLASSESQLRRFQADHPILVYGIAFAVYVGVTGLSLPGAAALTLLYGWYFGLWRGVIVVSFASTAGATLAFLLSRYLFGRAVQKRFGARLSGFNRALRREGPFFLFTLRLIPAVPFFVINLVMGLTPIRVRTFWWVSQLGMLAGTTVYVYAGSSVPSLQVLAEHGVQAVLTPGQLTQLVVAFALLGVFPLVVRLIVKTLRPRTDALPAVEKQESSVRDVERVLSSQTPDKRIGTP